MCVRESNAELQKVCRLQLLCVRVCVCMSVCARVQSFPMTT